MLPAWQTLSEHPPTYRVRMFAPGLAMLWEDTDPNVALAQRFGLADLEAAAGWVARALRDGWGLGVSGVERVLISDVNALAWAHTDRGVVVVKICSHEPAFGRLDAIAALLGHLDSLHLPVAAPIAGLDGRRRHVVPNDRPLSVAVQPRVEGDLLDVGDLAAVRAAGQLVGRLHLALADVDPGPFADGPREMRGDPRESITSTLDQLPSSRAPRAHARLVDLLSTLPALDTTPQLAHGDIRGANILLRGQEIAALLDFDEVSIRHRTVEISLGAVLLATEFRRWPPTPPEAQRTFLDGYADIVELTDNELGWSEALRLWFGLGQIPPGDDPAGWASAVENSIRNI